VQTSFHCSENEIKRTRPSQLSASAAAAVFWNVNTLRPEQNVIDFSKPPFQSITPAVNYSTLSIMLRHRWNAVYHIFASNNPILRQNGANWIYTNFMPAAPVLL